MNHKYYRKYLFLQMLNAGLKRLCITMILAMISIGFLQVPSRSVLVSTFMQMFTGNILLKNVNEVA